MNAQDPASSGFAADPANRAENETPPSEGPWQDSQGAQSAVDRIWHIAPSDFPHTGTPHEKWKFLLRYAILAPSSHNTQPWLFRISKMELELYADRSRSLRVSDPNDRELLISCGAALFHLRVALRHFGYFGSISIFPDPDDLDLLARVTMGLHGESSVEDSPLFHAILKRRTYRQLFQDDEVPQELLDTLSIEAAEEGAWLDVLHGAARQGAADLIAEADRIQWASKRFRLELAAWMRPYNSASQDGIPKYSFDSADLLSTATPPLIRTFDLGEGRAASDHDLAAYSPALVVLGSDSDGMRDWIASGQALARVLLRAQAEGVCASFLNQPIETPELRFQLGDLTGREGFPQILLRLGYGTEVRPTPRRSVDEVCI